jgi:phenylalanyl-tRNA synthetase alpha chain
MAHVNSRVRLTPLQVFEWLAFCLQFGWYRERFFRLVLILFQGEVFCFSTCPRTRKEMDMKEKLQQIKEAALLELKAADCDTEALRVRYLGKKGELTAVLRGMGALTPEERPVIGQMANEVRAEIEAALTARVAEEKEKALNDRLAREKLDVTMPGTPSRMGHQHPLTRAQREMEEIFIGMGFEIAEGPEVEYDYYNFKALNIPENHPARDTQDTFYITDNILLRSQTSPVQVRVMEKQSPPIRVISPGRVYRSDALDATHSPLFHQMEGLVVDKGITMSDLKGTLETFAKKMFGEETKIRFRPHHFPFTEPSAEVDVSCFVCGGKGCRVCKGEGWIEILGAGMVHPFVLENCGIDPEVYSGFAFGMGLERVTMTRYGIDDIRLFYENDERFLKQF